VLLSLAFAAACRTDAPPNAGAKGGDGILSLAMAGEPSSLNPNPGPDELAMIVGQNIFSRLVALTSDGSIVPDLAERWVESEDGLTYTFHLRRDARWHDGRPFVAEDVRQTFARVPEESGNRDLASRLAGVDAIDDHTVAIRLKAPWSAFIASLGWYGTSILPAHVYGASAWRDHPAKVQPIGTGPFRFKSWIRGSRVVLEKNAEYFGPGPYADGAEFLFAATPDEAVQMVVDGRAHVLIGRPPTGRIHELSRTPGLRVISAPAEGRSYLGFNLRRAPFDDPRVRRGINLAIDRRALIDRALSGVGTPAVGFYTPAVSWAYNGQARAPEHDPAAARRLLSSAVPASYVGSLLCPASLSTFAAEIVRQLSAAGLRLRVAAVPMRDYMERLMRTRDFDVAVITGSQGPDPDNLATRFGSSGAFQFMGYRSAEVDEALERGARESDVVARARAYFRVQEILAEDLPIAPLTESVRVTVFRDGLRGLPHDDARSLVGDYTFNLVRLRPSGD
jgi:peptide/nickel transport system substrate-binding protein